MKKVLLAVLIVILIWLLIPKKNEAPVVITKPKESFEKKEIPNEVTPDSLAETPKEVAKPETKTATEISEVVPEESSHSSESVSEIPETNIKIPENYIRELPVESMTEILKKTTPLKEVSGQGFFVPGCWTGEFYPYPGKPDRFEVELHWPAKGSSFENTKRDWIIYAASYLVIKKVGEIVHDFGPEKFRKPPELMQGTYGFLIVDEEKAVYQVIGEKGKVVLNYYEKQEASWAKLTEVRLSLSDGRVCNAHGYPLLPVTEPGDE